MSEEKQAPKKQRETDIVSEKRTVLYEVVRVLGHIVFHTVMPVRFHNRELARNQELPYLLISNHQHALDPVILAMMVPHEQLYFLGKKELGGNRFLKWAMDHLHCILVDRHNMDMDALRACMKVIHLKKGLIIFPEGTRHHEGQMEHIENGTSMIALRGKCPVIPVYVDRKLAFFRRTNVYVGQPIPCDDLLAEGINATTCEKMNDRLRETFRTMIRETDEAKQAARNKKS